MTKATTIHTTASGSEIIADGTKITVQKDGKALMSAHADSIHIVEMPDAPKRVFESAGRNVNDYSWISGLNTAMLNDDARALVAALAKRDTEPTPYEVATRDYNVAMATWERVKDSEDTYSVDQARMALKSATATMEVAREADQEHALRDVAARQADRAGMNDYHIGRAAAAKECIRILDAADTVTPDVIAEAREALAVRKQISDDKALSM